jgi:hypothetical protein
MLSRVNQEAVEVIELMIADEIVPKPCGRYKKRSIKDTGKGERVFEGDALIMETAMGKIGDIPFSRVPRERFSVR